MYSTSITYNTTNDIKELIQKKNMSNQDLEYVTCASHKTCDECINASYACHFCESDFQCHAIGSRFGCAKGMSVCHHLEDCLRKEPQYVGYGPPPSVVIAVLCIVVTITCCLCGLSSLFSMILYGRKRRKYMETYKESSSTSSKLPNPHDETNLDEPLLDNNNDTSEAMVNEDNRDPIRLDRVRVRRESEAKITWHRFWTRFAWFIGITSMTIALMMFYPRMPDYNVCNREFEWESILQSAISLHPKIHYELLISTINENMFGFVLESGRADIYHQQSLVGRWELNESAPIKAHAGAITDVIAEVKIEPHYADAYALWSDFRNNNLIFRINASVTGSITWGTYKLYQISSSVADIEFLVGAEYDRGLCKCTEYLTPQNSTL